MNKILFPWVVLTFVTMNAQAQSNNRRYLAPWEVVGISPHFIAQTQSFWQQVWDDISAKYFSEGQPLSTIIQTQSPTLNQLAYARHFIGTNSETLSYLMQPIICHIGNEGYVANSYIDIQSGRILNIDISSFSYQSLQAGNRKDLTKQIMAAVAGWPQTLTPPQLTTALKLATTIKRESLGHHHGELLCANLILAKALIPQYRVLNTIGQKNLLFVRRLGNHLPLQRSNRALHLDWQKPKESWQLILESSEGIFGTTIDNRNRWSIDKLTTDFAIPQELQDLLAQEELSLHQKTLPQVVKIYGAWAYLDKGRAWGLKINDRLVSPKGNKINKGHIVGFYGPKKNLKSPHGYPIHDGAILYIRKGQHVVEIGDSFAFDNKTYPSPWPPQAEAD